MYSYKIYELGIRSEVPLPQLAAEETPADVVIRLGELDPSSSEAIGEGLTFRVTAEGVYLHWQHVGMFLVRGGREIIVDPAPDVDEYVLCHFIGAPVLSVLLHQRGFLVLHAATVAVDDNAVAFIGNTGQGKSTLAMAFHSAGYGVVADDITAVTIDDEEKPVAISGPQWLKLCSDTILSMGDDPESFPLLEVAKKRARPVSLDLPQKPFPLTRIYILDEGSTHKIEPIGPQDAFVELVRNAFLCALLRFLEPSSYLLQFAKIVNAVPVRRLTMRKSYEALPDVIQMVRDDLSRVHEDVI